MTRCTGCSGPLPPTALNCPNCGAQRVYPIAPFNPPPPPISPAGSHTIPSVIEPHLQPQPQLQAHPQPHFQPAADPFNASAELYGFLAMYERGRPTGVHWPVMGGEQIVGREGAEPRPHIEVPDGTISSAHARFITPAGALHLEDLDSMNGTWVNEQKLEPGRMQLLTDGDEVRFGGTPFIVKLLPRS